ncbi:MAG: hypothetical protein ABIY70_22835 [Capsulimonas sp.]|uniref:tetratricopeptide repeat protein n=1 Tax=Capsulimonas sp. TaxID=2494211 RepID=UPI00326622F8
MKKHTAGLILGILLCISTAGHSQSPQRSGPGWGQGPNLSPRNGETPEQLKAHMTAMSARDDKIYRLDLAAKAALSEGNYAQAETSAQQSVALGIGSGLGQELLAAALDAQGKSRKALQVYKRISDAGGVFPHNELPYALLLLKSGHWAQAVAEYNKQLPYNSGANLMLPRTKFSPEKPNPAALAAAIHIGLGLTASWGGYHGDFTARKNQYLAQFRQAMKLTPNSPLANYYYGFGLIDLGRFAEAKAAFQKAASRDTGDLKVAAKNAIVWFIRPRGI